MLFEHELVIQAPAAQVWALLWDVERIAQCVPGLGDVSAIEPGKRYRGTITQRVGPFGVELPAEIVVLDVEEGRRVRAQITGEDRRIRSGVRLILDARLGGVPEGGIRISLCSDLELRGPLGTIGQGVVRRKADETVAAILSCIRSALEPAPPASGAPGGAWRGARDPP